MAQIKFRDKSDASLTGFLLSCTRRLKNFFIKSTKLLNNGFNYTIIIETDVKSFLVSMPLV